jgi:hypothetical protein
MDHETGETRLPVREPQCIDFHFDGGGEAAYPVLDVAVGGGPQKASPLLVPLVNYEEFFGSFIVACYFISERERGRI